MKKLTRKSKIVVCLLLLCIALIVLAVVVRPGIVRNECQDIIGDGYAMGTDPVPVVIGNTCD